MTTSLRTLRQILVRECCEFPETVTPGGAPDGAPPGTPGELGCRRRQRERQRLRVRTSQEAVRGGDRLLEVDRHRVRAQRGGPREQRQRRARGGERSERARRVRRVRGVELQRLRQ